MEESKPGKEHTIMTYITNSEYVKTVLEIKDKYNEIYDDYSKMEKFIKEKINTEEAQIQLAISGYLKSLEDGAEAAGVELDLTYDTVQNLHAALASLALLQAKGDYDNKHNAIALMHTLAAYLTLLAMNNHDLKISVEQMSAKPDESRIDLWMDMYALKFNLKKKSDFRSAAVKGLETQFLAKDGFLLDLDQLIATYKKVTGVDLEFYGLTSIAITGLNANENIKVLN